MAQETTALPRQPATVRFANGTTLSGVGGQGVLHQRRPEGGRLRSAAMPAQLDTSPQFQAAMDALGLQEQETLEFESIGPVAAGQGDEAVLAPAVPAGDARRRVVLYQDESGGLSWHFESDPAADPPLASAPAGRQRPGLRGGLRQASADAGPRFVIALRSQAVQATLRQGQPRRSLRGPITKFGRKIFKVLVLPWVAHQLESPVRWLAEQVEARWVPTLLWQPTPETYRAKPERPFNDGRALAEGPVLLLIHGIFSSVQGMLSRLPRDAMADWHQRYGGRVIAYNHATISASPEDNARDLLQQLKRQARGRPLTLDIVCHSRGGIVARSLIEQGERLVPGHGLRFRSAYFVAAPNAGSPLGDAEHMVDLIDLFTNFLGNFDDGPVTYAAEVLVGLAMLMGQAGLKGLPGIAALGTRDSFITRVLNQPGAAAPAIYGAAASDFEPRPGRENGFLIDRLGDPLLDRVFTVDGRRIGNDLVVPQQGVFQHNGHPAFPIANALVFAPEDGIWHSAFFAQEATLQHLGEHLGRVAAADAPAQGEAAGAEPPGDDAIDGGPGGRTLDLDALRDLADGDESDGPREVHFRAPDERFSVWNERARRRDRSSGSGDGFPDLAPAAGRRTARRGGLRGGASAAPAPTPARARPRASAERAARPRASAEPATVSRDPSLQFREFLEAGASAELLVQLQLPTDDAPAAPGRITLTFDPGAREVELDAVLSAPGFTVAGKPVATLRIRRRRDAALEQARFMLTALDPGPQPVDREIIVSFYRGNDLVGSVTHHTVVAQPGAGSTPRSPQPNRITPVSVGPQRRESADLILQLRQPDKGRDLFELSLRSQLVSEAYESRDFGTFDLGGQALGQYLSDALDPHFQRFPGAGLTDAQFDAALQRWNTNFLTALSDLGQALWTHLPVAFRNEYLRLAGLGEPIRSIAIYSDELTFPWEIVRPSGRVNRQYMTLPPLGMAHVIARWRPGIDVRPRSQDRPVTAAAIVMPDATDSGLPWVAEELAELKALLPHATAIEPVTRQSLDALLASDRYELVHFAGHGITGPNADLNALQLAGGANIPAMAFAAGRLAAEKQPLLVLNACSVGRSQQLMSRPGGFAAQCIEGGWGGLVAAYWPVYDVAASAFTSAFYRKLLSGRSVAEALTELRTERPDDPTVLSYTYYGDPFARLSMP